MRYFTGGDLHDRKIPLGIDVIGIGCGYVSEHDLSSVRCPVEAASGDGKVTSSDRSPFLFLRPGTDVHYIEMGHFRVRIHDPCVIVLLNTPCLLVGLRVGHRKSDPFTVRGPLKRCY